MSPEIAIALIVGWILLLSWLLVAHLKNIYRYTKQLIEFRKTSKGNHSTIGRIQCLSTFAIGLFTLMMFWWYSFIIIGILIIYDIVVINWNVINPIDQFVWGLFGCGLTLLRIFHLYRLKLTFENSSYKINKSTMIIIMILLIVSWILVLTLFRVLVASGLLIESIVDLMIAYLFNKKLLSLIIQMDDGVNHIKMEANVDNIQKYGNSQTMLKSESASFSEPLLNISDNMDKDIDWQFDKHQTQLLKVGAKQTVLTCISCILSFVASILYSISHLHLSLLLIVIGLIFVLCNYLSVTLWLSFSFAETEYQSRCKTFHSCFLTVFRQIAMCMMHRA